MSPAATEPAGGEGEGSPRALVRGEILTRIPQDLYIPPHALEVFLETFEGPLDLLLYLIKRQNLDILDIPIADITRQYMQYIEMMQEMRLELAAEYLVMAAMLAEIKSRMLLPRPVIAEDEEDPRAELVRRLQEYERFRHAARDLDALPRAYRELFPVSIEPPVLDYSGRPAPVVSLEALLHALSDVLSRADMFSHHHVQLEPLSVRERMTRVLEMLSVRDHVEFVSLFSPQEGRRGVVVTFLAVLELVKEHLVECVQTDPFTPLHLRAAS